jgi:acyl carrier protein
MTPQAPTALEEALRTLTAQTLGLDARLLDRELPLQDQGMSSLQFVVLITRIENEFGIRWTDADFRELAHASLRTAALLLKAKGMAAAPAGG